MRMNLVFMGTPAFAVPSLELLSKSRHKIEAVITQPDSRKGRGLKICPSPVKQAAIGLGLPVYEFEKVSSKKGLEFLARISPEIIIVVAFGQILSREVLSLPRFGCINAHASLLPKYRGASPINWCIINNERYSGITIMLMDEGLDTGDILLQKQIELNEDDDALILYNKLASLSAESLLKVLDDIEDNTITPLKQDHTLSSYAPKITKEDGKIDWRKSALEISCLVRGLLPWPNAFTSFQGKVIKIKRSIIDTTIMDNGKPGEVVHIDKEGIYVATGKGCLLVRELQPENGRIMKASDFVRGYNRLTVGSLLC